MTETPTGQQWFERTMRERIAPIMKGIGFSGTSGKFKLKRDPYAAHVNVQKSRGNSRDVVEFTFNLDVLHMPTKTTLWALRLGELMPSMGDKWWIISSEETARQAAADAANALREFGWLAIKAKLEDLEYLSNHHEKWSRTFPPGNLNGHLHPQRNSWAHEAHLWSDEEASLEIESDVPFNRMLAILEVKDRHSMWNAHNKQKLFNCLEHDGNPLVRVYAARVLGLMKGNDVTLALQDMALQDEDPFARWGARYSLILRRDLNS